MARESDLIPLATDTYGGYAKSTWVCMHRQAAAAANNDMVLQGKLVRRVRDQIATAIVLGHRGDSLMSGTERTDWRGRGRSVSVRQQ